MWNYLPKNLKIFEFFNAIILLWYTPTNMDQLFYIQIYVHFSIIWNSKKVFKKCSAWHNYFEAYYVAMKENIYKWKTLMLLYRK